MAGHAGVDDDGPLALNREDIGNEKPDRQDAAERHGLRRLIFHRAAPWIPQQVGPYQERPKEDKPLTGIAARPGTERARGERPRLKRDRYRPPGTAPGAAGQRMRKNPLKSGPTQVAYRARAERLHAALRGRVAAAATRGKLGTAARAEACRSRDLGLLAQGWIGAGRWCKNREVRSSALPAFLPPPAVGRPAVRAASLDAPILTPSPPRSR